MQQNGFGTFWSGPNLGEVEHACLSSFPRAGQTLYLFSYDTTSLQVPDGIVLRDASDILPLTPELSEVLGQYPARFSDFFRLKMMQQMGLIWVDCDVYFLKPVTCNGSLLTVGREYRGGARHIWNGVMYLDPESDLFADYLGMFTCNQIEFRDSWNAKIAHKGRDESAVAVFDRVKDVHFFSNDLPRSFFGPILLSLLALDHPEVTLTPPPVHYPYGAPKIRKNTFKPQIYPLEKPRDSETLHFYGSMARKVSEGYRSAQNDGRINLPPGSLLAQAFAGTL